MIWLFCVAAHAERPLTVEEAVSLAIERNPNLESQRLAEVVASIDETRARLDRFTAQVSGNGTGELGVTKPWGAPSFDSSQLGWNASATAGVPLYAGGRIDASIDAARAGADIATVNVQLTQRDLVRAAYTAYWNLKGLELQIDALEEGLEATRQALDIIESKATNGLAAGIDVNRSTVDLLSQEESLVAQRAARVQARQELVQLLAIEDEELTLSSEPPHPTEGAVTLPSDPLAGRPELKRQELSVEQAQASVRLARSAALPTVLLSGTVTANAGVNNSFATAFPTLATAVDPEPLAFGDLGRPLLSASAGVSVVWNPFDLLRTRQSVQQAKLRADQVAAQNEAERLRIAADIRAAAARLDALRARFPLVDRQVALARDNQDIVRDLYAQGSATILDLFNAQSAFRAAAVQEASLLVDLATAELDYRWLLGADPLSGVSP